MIRVREGEQWHFVVVVEGSHQNVMEGILQQGGTDAAAVIAHALNMCLRADKHNLLLKGIANVMERKDG